MRPYLSLLAIATVIVSLLSVSGLALAGPSYDVVYVDDDGPVGGNHFQDLALALAATAPDAAIYIAAGSYYLSSPLSPCWDVAFIGEGADVVSIYGYGLSSVFSFYNVSVYIYGCTIVGANTGVAVSWTDTATYGAYLHKNTVWENTTAETGISFSIEDAEAHIDIIDNDIFENCGYGIALDIEDAEVYCTIAENLICDNEGSGISVISEGSYLDLSIESNEICRNGEFTNNTGIYLSMYGYNDGFMSIENNLICDNYGDGISMNFHPSLPDAQLDGNVPTIVDQFEVVGNTIHGNGKNGISMCVYTPPSAHLDGDDVFEGVMILSDAIVSGNIIADNTLAGITLTFSFPGEQDPLFGEPIPEWLSYGLFIEKNMILGNGLGGIYCNSPFDIGIFNNLIAGNDGIAYGVRLETSGADLLHNTIIYNSSGVFIGLDAFLFNNIVAFNEGYGISGLSRCELDGNSVDGNFLCNDVWENGCCPADNYFNFPDMTGYGGNISADPLFAGPSDAHLQLGSPCINTGWGGVYPFVQDDLEGMQRPLGAGYDMGCYESLSQNWAPHVVQPLAALSLSHANSFWNCLKENLPEDVDGQAASLIGEIQSVMEQAVMLGNPIKTNGLMQQALGLMSQLEALLECGCS